MTLEAAMGRYYPGAGDVNRNMIVIRLELGGSKK